MIFYWLTAFGMLVVQGLSLVLPEGFLGPVGYWRNHGHIIAIVDPCVFLLLGVTELWLRREKKVYLKRAVLLVGLIYCYILYFLLKSVIDSAEIVLVMPLLISLVYFERMLIKSFASLNILLYVLVTLIPFALGWTTLNVGQFIIVLSVLITGTLLGQGVITRSQEMRKAVEELIKSEQKFIVEKAISDKLLKMDALTGLYNHKTFHEYLENLIQHAKTMDVPIHLAIMDLDNFKAVNDVHGHWVGDLVLSETAQVLLSLMTPNDFAARYGGEEFAVIFADTTPEEAMSFCEAVRTKIADIRLPELGERTITISCGLCSYFPGEDKENLFRHADDALYRAKRSGKNRVIIYNNDPVMNLS